MEFSPTNTHSIFDVPLTALLKPCIVGYYALYYRILFNSLALGMVEKRDAFIVKIESTIASNMHQTYNRSEGPNNNLELCEKA